ncbi:hypothetical protein ABTW24_24280 [Sphingobacterium thalpophilum]|uniref:Carboxypeptidase regulatory-like domain-containing protein n=1 Tax=Sphingobacterium thalpophilum TaxID=259 RepID=A0ABV4HNB6_9SPHI
MKRKLNISLVMLISIIGLSCSKSEVNTPQESLGSVKGKVLTSDGRPVAGAKIVISSVIWYNENNVVTTAADGTYKRKLVGPDNDAWYAYASIEKEYNGKKYTIDLHPESTEDFLPSKEITRNFTWKLTGEQIGRSTGIYGGMVTVGSEPGEFYDFTNVILTLTPQGPLIDGSKGSKLVIAVPASQRLEVPIGRYNVSAVYAVPGKNQKPMRVRLSNTGSYNTNAIVDFTPSTDYCKNCMTIDIKE